MSARLDERIGQHLPLAPTDFLVLRLLDDGDRHGYAMVHEIEAMTEGQIKLMPGNFYGVLRRLVRDGLIEQRDRRTTEAGADQRRRYYRITPVGRAVATAEAARLKSLMARIEAGRLLTEEPS